MEQFSIKLDSYTQSGHTRGYINHNEVPWIDFGDQSPPTSSTLNAATFHGCSVNGRLTYLASASSNSIHVMMVDHTTELYKYSSSNTYYIVPGNAQKLSYALIGINLSGMSNVVFPSSEDDVELYTNNIEHYNIRIFNSRGFQVYHNTYNSVLWTGGDTSGKIDFDINLSECAIQFIRSTTYGGGVVYPTDSKIVFSPKAWFNSDNSSCEFEVGTTQTNRLVSNLQSAYGGLYVTKSVNGYTLYHKSNPSYNYIAMEYADCYAIPSPCLSKPIDSNFLTLTIRKESDLTNNNELIELIKENVDEVLPKDYITR